MYLHVLFPNPGSADGRRTLAELFLSSSMYAQLTVLSPKQSCLLFLNNTSPFMISKTVANKEAKIASFQQRRGIEKVGDDSKFVVRKDFRPTSKAEQAEPPIGLL